MVLFDEEAAVRRPAGAALEFELETEDVRLATAEAELAVARRLAVGRAVRIACVVVAIVVQERTHVPLEPVRVAPAASSLHRVEASVRGVIDHVTIRVSDRAAAESFYSTVLAEIGPGEPRRTAEYSEWDNFSLAEAAAEKPPTEHVHIGFRAPSREHVDKFWSAGIAAGYRDDGAPGERPVYSESYYGGFLLDPDGNSAEAVHGEWAHEAPALIDHLWMRVADVAAARRFYQLVSTFAGLGMGTDTPERAQFSARNGTFSLVAGEHATAHVHLAFAAADNATVDAFHEALTAAGYEDNGPPGERAVYHPGYYGAFVLDPDGNNIELVCHNR